MCIRHKWRYIPFRLRFLVGGNGAQDSYASEPGSDVLVLTVKLPAGTKWTLPGFAGKIEGAARSA